jgi:phage shock protein A
MSTARRIAELYEAKMNAVLDRAADPRELADYSYAQLRELLAEVKRDTVQVAASRKHAERRVSELRHAADRLGEQAEQAVAAGRPDLARQALSQRAALRAQVSGLREQQNALLAAERKLSAAERQLRAKVEEFGVRKETIKAANTAARAQASIAEAFTGISGDVTNADLAARWAEDEAADLEARASALDDLLVPGAAALSDEQLQAQLDQISTRAEVDEELARLRGRLASEAARGHRTIRHTADLRVEAWAPTREECIAEAVRGLVDGFAVVAGRRPHGRIKRHMRARSDEDLLIAVIDEVIYQLDADGMVPVSVAVRSAQDDGVVLFVALIPVSEAEIIGAAPKAASLHDLRCAPDAAGRWSCGVTVDVQPQG